MAFQLDSVVSWGRNLEEYILMFQFQKGDNRLLIIRK